MRAPVHRDVAGAGQAGDPRERQTSAQSGDCDLYNIYLYTLPYTCLFTYTYHLIWAHILLKAREALPTEPLTWIAAAKLEEANNSGAGIVDRIIEKMLASLGQHEVVIGREQWLQEAQQCERSGALLTCAAIVRNTLAIGVEDEDRLATWMDGKRPTCYYHKCIVITTIDI